MIPVPASGHKEADASGAGALAGLADLLLLLRLRLREAVGLVLDVDGHLGQRLGVLAAVMSAEKQFP